MTSGFLTHMQGEARLHIHTHTLTHTGTQITLHNEIFKANEIPQFWKFSFPYLLRLGEVSQVAALAAHLPRCSLTS